ncbi:ribosome-dependent mRNA decay endonuclease Rae1/YacP [soil metagenome]
MALILDGYNIIGALQRYRQTDNFATARDLLINDTLKAAGWTGQEIILVFDAQRSPEAERVELLAGGAVRVIYSATGRSADDVIERLLDNLSSPSTVYTADFALQRTALARGAARATPREFDDLLDELPVLTRHPETRQRSSIGDRLSPEIRRKLEELRRKQS